jgi:hypothetical protein
MAITDAAHSFDSKPPVSDVKRTGGGRNLDAGHFALEIACRRFRIVAPLVVSVSIPWSIMDDTCT